MSDGRSQERRRALIALLLVLLPNLLLTALGLVTRNQAREVAEARAAGRFGPWRLLRQVGLQGFFLLPTGLWLWRRGLDWVSCGSGRRRLARALALGALLAVPVLLLRARPLDPERLHLDDTWWALATYTAVAAGEETLYRGLLQGALSNWLGRWWGYATASLLFTALHVPQLLLGGEPLAGTLVYAAGRLLPMALLFGGLMLAARHVAATILVHLAWNWATMLRSP